MLCISRTRLTEAVRSHTGIAEEVAENCTTHDDTGMTVIELLVASVVFGMLALMAVVTLGSLAPRFNLDNGARLTAMGLIQARMQAISRGHTMEVTFATDTLTIIDTDNADEILAHVNLPSGITISAGSDATFTPLGIVPVPRTITVSNGDDSRNVSVGLTGEVQIQ